MPIGRQITGTSRGEFLLGWWWDDRIDAGAGNDWIFAGGGNDVINGGKGNDFIFAGPGTDTVEFSGSYQDYTWGNPGFGLFNLFGSSVTVTGTDGSDWLFGVELLRFDDATVDLRTGAIMVDNRAPVAVDDTASITEDATPGTVSGNVLTNDIDLDGDTLIVLGTGVYGMEHGKIAINENGTYTYTLYNNDPAVNGLGVGETLTDRFLFNISDGHGGADSGYLTITINGSNDAPIGNATATLNATEDVPYTISADDLLQGFSDPDGDALSVTGLASSHGTVTDNGDGTFTLNLPENFNGSAAFDYTVIDGNGGSVAAHLGFTVNPVNDAPVANDDAYTIAAGGALTIGASSGVFANDTDADGDSLSAVHVSYTLHHEVFTFNFDGGFFYKPLNDFHGTDSFTYQVYDGLAYSDPVTVSLTVTPVNDAPVAVDDYFTAYENTPLLLSFADMLANDIDADGDTLDVLTTHPSLGGYFAYNHDLGEYFFTPSNGFTGRTKFDYTIDDGHGGESTGTVYIDVVAQPAVVAFADGWAI